MEREGDEFNEKFRKLYQLKVLLIKRRGVVQSEFKKFRLKAKLVVLSLVAILLLVVLTSVAFSFSHSGIRWWSKTVYVKYDSSVPDSWQQSGALYNARKAWNTAGSKFRLYYDSSSKNLVKAGYSGNTDWLAKTTIYFNIFGYITQAIVEFNRSHPWSTNGASNCYDVQNIATHEFGHWLKLNDLYSSSDYYKTMYGFADLGETYKRTLHSDDIAGIKYIYGSE